MKILVTFAIILSTLASSSQGLRMHKKRVVIIADASLSMEEFFDGYPKSELQSELINTFADKALEYAEIEIALRVFGSGDNSENNCLDTKLQVPFQIGNTNRVKSEATKAVPTGSSPIGSTLLKTKTDFPKQENQSKYVLLIVDGTETCNRNLCEIYEKLKTEHIAVHIIGINVDALVSEDFTCFAHFHNTSSREEAANELMSFFDSIKPY